MRRSEKLTELTESRAEVRIGIIRMLIAAAMGLATLYMINKTGEVLDEAGRRGLTIALLAIGFYLLLGFVSVIAVWIGTYRGWMAWIFSLLEILLLSANLFFHVQAMGANSLAALSSPAAFAIALALVLQVLYQRPALQIISALALIGATALIIGFRANMGGLSDGSTAVFLQQNYTGLANAVRIFSLLLIAVIAGLAVTDGRRARNDVEAEAEKRINIARFVPDELLQQMEEEDFPSQDQCRVAEHVIMIVELRGFTALRHELGAEEAARLLGGFRERVSLSAARWNGVVERFAGDSAQVIFGLHGSTEAAARSAIDAALSLMDEISSWNAARDRGAPPIHQVTAIHLGEVMVGMIGGERRREFSAVGSAINDTYRIASAAIQKNLLLIASEPILHLSGIDAGGADWLDLEMGIQRADSDPVRLYGLNIQ